VLKNRSRVRPPDYVEDMAHDLFVVPTAGELGLAWLANSVPVTAATARLAVEYVGTPLRRDVDVLHLRPVRGIDRIPTRTFRSRVASPMTVASPLTVRGGPERLVVLLATARLGRLRSWRGNVVTRSASGNLPLRPGIVIIRPI